MLVMCKDMMARKELRNTGGGIKNIIRLSKRLESTEYTPAWFASSERRLSSPLAEGSRLVAAGGAAASRSRRERCGDGGLGRLLGVKLRSRWRASSCLRTGRPNVQVERPRHSRTAVAGAKRPESPPLQVFRLHASVAVPPLQHNRPPLNSCIS